MARYWGLEPLRPHKVATYRQANLLSLYNVHLKVPVAYSTGDH